MNPTRVFFLGLSELRGIAALAVVINHIELFKKRERIPSLYDTWLEDFISTLGKNGVYLFFVLSGFLITYLLLFEIKTENRIDIRKFYVRRILRIWPLYYIVVLFCLLLLPEITDFFSDFFGDNYYVSLLHEEDFPGTLRIITFVLFLPNLALILFPPVAGASQSWSVGVEEQFYLIWPIVLNRFKNRIFMALLLIILCKATLYFGAILLASEYESDLLKTLILFLRSFNIELMALGGIGAVALQRGYLGSFLAKVRKTHVWLLVVLISILMIIGVNYILLAFLFLVLILFNIGRSSNVTENRLVSFLGDISYGIYMFHPLMMFFSFSLTRHLFGDQNLIVFNGSFYIVTITSTLLISFLSFRYFESLFLRIKDRYTVIPSGSEGKRLVKF